MKLSNKIVFLVDVDDTLLENDRTQDDRTCAHLRAQGGRTSDPKIQAEFPQAADLTIEHIGDLLQMNLSQLIGTKIK